MIIRNVLPTRDGWTPQGSHTDQVAKEGEGDLWVWRGTGPVGEARRLEREEGREGNNVELRGRR